MRPELWRKAEISQIKQVIMAQFGSVIPNVVRELRRANVRIISSSQFPHCVGQMFASFLLVRSLTTFGMTDLWGGEFRSFFVAGIGGEQKSDPFSWPGFDRVLAVEFSL